MTKLILTLLAAATAAPAFAQSDTIQPATDAQGDAIVVTASRSGDAVRTDQLGASVTVLDAAALDQRQTRIVSDILRDVPGVAVSRAGAIGGFTQLRIRGSESNHVLVLIDGIEVSDPYQGEYDFSSLIADDAARIEVLRGQQSSLYGSDAIGGVVQYISSTGRETPGYSARAEGGSFGTYSGAARAGGVAGALDYAVTGSYYHTGGTPTARGGTRDIGSDSVGASAKVNWDDGGPFKLTAVGRYSLTDADTNDTAFSGPLYGTIVDSPGVKSRNQAFYGLVRAELALLDGRWTNALTGQIADTTRKGYEPSGLNYGDKGRRYKGSFESAIRFGGDTVRHRITGAVDVEREEFRNISPQSAFYPFFRGQRHTDNVGLVGEYELTVGEALALGGSVRRDLNDRFADATTFRVQGSYKLANGTRFHAAYGTGVKDPGYYELFGYSDGQYIGNPNLKPEKSKGWEAGVEQDFADHKATIGATWFDNRLTDEIFTTYPPPAYVASPANRTTDSKQRGLEVYASARPIPELRFDLAYTYLHARENGLAEVRRPKHVGSVNVTAQSPDERFSTTLTVRYNGRQDDLAYIDPVFFAPVRVSLQEYVLVNLAAEYRITPRIALFGRVENLFDERYEELFSYATSGRAAYGGVRVRL